MKKSLAFVAPFAFAMSVPIVAILVLGCVIGIESKFELHTWYRVGDIDGGIALTAVATVVFTPLTYLFIRLEQIEYPGVWDHIRHSLLLYVMTVVTSTWLVWNYAALNGAIQYAYVIGLCSTTVFGILINGLTLAVVKWRKRRNP